MNNDIKRAILLPALLVCTILHAQSPQENLDKYWNYRTKFYNKFIVDVNPGALPTGASENGINIPASTYNSSDIGDREYTLSFGSETPSQIGEYMGALATEYALQNSQNLSLYRVKDKLIRVMDAFNRLDKLAEPIYGCGLQLGNPPCTDRTNLNGFFIRTDMDQSFLDFWQQNGMTYWNSVNSLYSPYKTWISNPEGGNQVSQDQVWGLLLGTSLVKHFVDDGVNAIEDYPCDYISINKLARRQTTRTIRYMQSHNNNSPWIYCDSDEDCYPGEWPGGWLEQSWRIKNACTGSLVPQGGGWIDLRLNEPHFEDAGEWITGNSLQYSAFDFIDPLWPFGIFWPLPLVVLDNDHFHHNTSKLLLSTIAGNHYASDVEELLWNIRKCADYFNHPLPWNPNDHLNPYDLKYFWMDHLPMMSVLFHNEPVNSLLFLYYYSHIEHILNEAPALGPSNFSTDPKYVWTTGSILRQPIGHFYTDNSSHRIEQLAGEYAGIDYMLLFNLYHLVYQSAFNEPVSITDDYPRTYYYDYSPSYDWEYGNDYIDIGHKYNNDAYFTIHSKDLITMNSTVNADGKLCLRGNEVLLQPGFEVKNGGEFTAETNEIMDLDFTPPTGNYKSASANSYLPSIETITENRRTEAVEDQFDPNSFDQFRIYPNPATGSLYIESPSQISNITLYDSNGTIVTQTCGEGYEVMSLDVSGHNPGIYFISTTMEDGSVEVNKVIIE